MSTAWLYKDTELWRLKVKLQEGYIKKIHKVRIELRPEGGYSVMNVTDELPEKFMDELPPYLMDKLSLLLLLDVDTEATGLGYRYNQTVFYVDGE